MNKKQYKISQLAQKYADFSVPTMQVKINGKSVEGAGIIVANLTAEVSVKDSANTCTFEILNAYDIKQRSFEKRWFDDYFKPGSLVEILLGYIEVTQVFKGYISMVSAEFTESEYPILSIECMDVKGIMMNELKSEKKVYKTYSDAVKKIFSEYSVLAKKTVIDTTEDLTHPIEQNRQSDYEFVLGLAKKLNYEFFALGDTVYFREPRKITTPIISFEWGQYITSFSREIGLSSQVSEVVVRGYDSENSQVVEGKASKVKKAGKGKKDANQMTSLLKGTKVTLVDEAITTAEEAKKRAEAELDQRSMNFVRGHGTCIGLPELIPGRFMELKNFDPTVDNHYYITGVKHSFSESGFSTSFEVAVNMI